MTCTMNKVGNFAIIGMNMASGRLVKLALNPISRIGFYDSDITGDYSNVCWGLCYDIDNGIIYAGINSLSYLTGNTSCEIHKINVSTMTLISKLTISTNPPGSFSDSQDSSIRGMIRHPENGMIYIVEVGNQATPLSKISKISISDFSIQQTKEFIGRITENPDGLYIDKEKGKLYSFYSGNGFYQSYLYRFDTITLEMDILKAPIGIFSGWAGYILGKTYNKCTGMAYCAYISNGDGYPNYEISLAEINVDTMSVVRTLILPALPSGGTISADKIDISDTHLYILGEDNGTGEIYVQIIDMASMQYTGVSSMIGTSGDYEPLYAVEIGVLRDDDILVIYCPAYNNNLNGDAVIYREYDISNTIPVQSGEVLFDDPDFRESGNVYSSMVISQKYAVIEDNNGNGGNNNSNDGNIISYIPGEYLENYFFVDSGLTYNGDYITIVKGLDHIEGEVVSILADGVVVPQQVVKDGQIVLETPAKRIHVGLPYKSILQTMEPEIPDAEGTAKGRMKRINRCVFRLYNTNRFLYGSTPESEMKEATFGEVEQKILFNGDEEKSFPTGWGREGFVTIVQDKPVPITVVAIIPEMGVS